MGLKYFKPIIYLGGGLDEPYGRDSMLNIKYEPGNNTDPYINIEDLDLLSERAVLKRQKNNQQR